MSCCCWRQDDDIKEIYEPALAESRQAYLDSHSSPIFDDRRDTYRSPSPISESDSVVSGGRQHGGSVRGASTIGDDTSAFGTISIYSCSEYERAVIGGSDAMSTSTLLPTWMNDKETETCWGCRSLFQTKTIFSSFIPVSGRSSPMDKTRKHHCRRCRNVFCGACTANKQIVLLARGSDINGPGTSSTGTGRDPNKLVPTRVCDACTLELPAENQFLHTQRPLLLQGEVFKKVGGFLASFSARLSRLSLTADEFSLLVQTGKDSSAFSDGTDQRSTVVLGEVEEVRITKLTRLEIEQTDGEVLALEADTAATVRNWEAALKVAVSRAKQGSLKNRIELERRQRIENNRRGEEQEKKNEYMAQKREVARQERDALRNKYKR